MSAESPRHARTGGGPLTVPSQPPTDRGLIDAVSGFISDVTLSSSSQDPKDVIQWARFETADINEPTSEADSDTDISPLLLVLGYGSGVQAWLIPPTGEAQEVLSWRQGIVRVLRILPSPQRGDCFASKRPLVALCDSVSPGPSFCSLSFLSIRGGEQVKSIKFKNQILDVVANKRSVVVSFAERFAVFDAGTLEDRLAVTTCYPSPCPLGGLTPVNPLALGDRWLAYADKKLNQSKRSSGGCEGEGQTSYTATVLHAAKSLSKGLRGLGESVANSLAGGRASSQSPSPPNTDSQQPGVVTIVDIEGADEEGQDNEEPYDPIVAHFIAHTEAIVALKFDTSGLLLITADRRGHDFHVFRINPHPCGPSLASVHHLYVLHRGDTTAKVQDIAISPDTRWAAISTLRGTTHIFPISPYGGQCGVRTHTAPRVVNRLSRFQRSAGLPIHTAHPHAIVSGSPVSDGLAQGAWFPNPRLPPYPLPVTVPPLAQLRPTHNLPTHTITRTSSGRQRLSSQSEDVNTAPLLARARFGPAPAQCGAAPSKAAAVNALYLVASTGCLSHIALHPKPLRSIPKEKVCDESPIELEVEPLAQWALQRVSGATDLLAPLPPSNPLLQPSSCRRCADMCMSEEERWLSQVEIVTHAGPHRRLWMGPQFVFKTYNCGSNSSLSEAETVEVELSTSRGVARSNPVNMPGTRPIVPVLIDSGSNSECSLEHSPSDSFRRKSLLAETGRAAFVCDVQLKEDLAEAMKEDHGWRSDGSGNTDAARGAMRGVRGVARVVDPQGTVLAPPVGRSAPKDDNDDFTSNNDDEATFRPVVRAPNTLSLSHDMLIRPLPRTTTIPVQNVSPTTSLSPQDEPVALNTDVFIPAALTSVQGCHASNQLEEAELHMESVLLDAVQSKSEDTVKDDFKVENPIDRTTTEKKTAERLPQKKSDLQVAKCDERTTSELDQAISLKEETSNKQKADVLINKNTEEKPKKSRSKEKEKIAVDKKSKQKDAEITRQKETPPSDHKEKSVSEEKASRQKEMEITPTEKIVKQKEHSTDKTSRRKEKESTPDDKDALKPTLGKSSRLKEVSVEKSVKKKESSLEKDLSMKVSASDKTMQQKEIKPKQEKLIVTEDSGVNKQSKNKDKSKIETPSGPKDNPIKLDRSEERKESAENAVKKYKEAKEDNVDNIAQMHVADNVTNIDIINIDVKETNINEDLKCKEIDARKCDREYARKHAVCDDSKSLPKLNELSDDIQPTARNRVKKSPTPKSVSDRDSEVSLKDNNITAIDDTCEVIKKDINPTKEVMESKEISNKKENREVRNIKNTGNEDKVSKTELNVNLENITCKTELRPHTTFEPSVEVTLKFPTKKERVKSEDHIKTEEQAWDMLLNEPEKPVILNIDEVSAINDKSADEKSKSKKNRKLKKCQEDAQSKSEEDSFVEIHAIDDKQQICSGELVSISTPFENIEPVSTYFSKSVKGRTFKSCTPEKRDDWGEALDILAQPLFEPTPKPRSSKKFDVTDIGSFTGPSFSEALKESSKDFGYSNVSKNKIHTDGTYSESTSILVESQQKKYKSKSLSPYPDLRKTGKVLDKDVYVINTTEEEFPEIQVTKGNKTCRRSPQAADRSDVENVEKAEKETVSATIKSWSSIAASKNKKPDEAEPKVEVVNKVEKTTKMQEKNYCKDKKPNKVSVTGFENPMSSTTGLLQDKLLELYKRSDIVMAECDEPTELNFMEEHHSVIDLPPLEPLDFGLDDFKLEVMRDSLLDVSEGIITSPICKINIDDILTSIKETTSKAIESSAFNLIDLDKVPVKKERGFSVIESHQISSQDVTLEDDVKEEETTEKSSDDDNASPIVMTDSDKEDKKSAGANNLVLPSKQSAKSKKPRRKKK